ncbi:SoxR reducing system RseC family protein [Thermodesulfobacteriota bacterium]
MAQEEGVVASVEKDGWSQVITTKGEACADCSSSQFCGAMGSGTNMVVKALNRVNAGIGDRVTLEVGSGTLLKSAMIVYLLPVLGLIGGMIIGSEVGGKDGSNIHMFFSFGGLALGFLLTVIVSRGMSADNRLNPVITHIKKAALQGSEFPFAIDPVCKMIVETETAHAKLEFNNRTYYFCHPTCQEKFQKSPDKYMPVPIT